MKRRRLFDRGAAALEAIGVPAGGGYGCPVCLRVFSATALEAKVLTFEHVPPKSMGGKAITLTCVECNSTAGAGPDAAMRRRQVLEDFWGGHGEKVVMKQTMGGHEVSVNVQRVPDGGMFVAARPKQTHPVALVGWKEYLESKAEQGGSWGFSLTVRWYDPQLAAIADLRAAYLAAFAKLGYLYILSPALKTVRAQLEKPKERILRVVRVTQASAALDARTLVVIETPIPCLGVQLGRRPTILPWPPSGVDPFEAIPATSARGATVSIRGKALPWPTDMELVLDLGAVAAR